MTTFRIDERTCVRCGACSSLAPAVFEIDARGSRIARQPETDDEWRLAEAALLNCPTAAIKRSSNGPSADAGDLDVD